ncbi:hypothetical protein FWK35_00025002 [Aphis craccivora]|uniref:Uncharacterized protein n=1 Tax=Aphis craccivora TaxID=307492 RepID=A0A6G0VW19_APHCR|nr:hypothetical protein FWK35_00025002 [Aphis craccivora]
MKAIGNTVFKNGSDVCNSVLMLREGTLKVIIIKL